MSRIIELPEVLANQIAAGEVIERPASVVKELVENAIDAGSRQITILIEESGLKRIQVTDDGEGMTEEEVTLSLKRHATSKIKTQADLFRIRTLGFRGEALPSIASVSRLSIETATRDSSHGTRLEASGGQVTSLSAIACPKGTSISVEDLFFNTPARLKYMKSLQAELAHIVDTVNRLSLGHPEIAFRLVNDGHQTLQTTGNGDLKQTLAGIYGLQTAKKMIPIEAEDLDFQISGYVSLPELTRASRHYLTLLINGRYIKNFLLNRAILEGYGSKLMVGRFPIAVIAITIDPYLADVNVHPTKQEVRLSKEKELMTLIQGAIESALREERLIPLALENLAKSSRSRQDKPIQTSFSLPSAGSSYLRSDEDRQNRQAMEVAEGLQVDRVVNKGSYDVNDIDETVKVGNKPLLAERQEWATDLDHGQVDFSNKRQRDKLVERLETEETSSFPELDYFGQMHGTYLFAQGKEGLYIIDQHAAQERVKYEYYREAIGQVDESLQQLLVPYLFEFSPSDILQLQEKMPYLNEVGIFLELYGDNLFILREHPIWMAEQEIESAVYEMCDMLLLTNAVSVKQYRAELAIMMSCKRSIKANHALDDYSAVHLLAQLAQCKNPYNCPHGRPVLVHFSKGDMEKMFRRIQENHRSLRELGKY